MLALDGVLTALGSSFLLQLRLGSVPVPIAVVISGAVNTALVWVVLLDQFVWQVLPDGMTWLGAAIIVASGLYMFRRERVVAVPPSHRPDTTPLP